MIERRLGKRGSHSSPNQTWNHEKETPTFSCMKSFPIFLMALLILGCKDDRTDRIRSAPLLTSTFVDQSGNQISIKGRADRIISLSPSITETLFAIGAGDQVVARSEACDYPEDALFLPSVSMETELNSEAMSGLDPQVILLPDGLLDQEAISQLQASGLPILTVKTESLADVYESIRVLGKLSGHPEQAKILADSLQQTEQLIVSRTQNLIQYGTVILVESDPLTVTGGSGLFQELIEKAGGKNRFEGAPFVLYTTTEEELYTMKPEYIFIPSREQQVYQLLVEKYPALYETPAAALNQVFVMDPDLIYRPGPRIIEGLSQMARTLHSDLTDL